MTIYRICRAILARWFERPLSVQSGSAALAARRLGILLLALVAVPSLGHAAPARLEPALTLESLLSRFAPPAPSFFKICKDQTYALCATAKCSMYNGVAYCKCDVEHGDSISLPFRTGPKENVCTVNADGVDNGYMVSTYSLPPEVTKPKGDMALYSCPSSSTGAYAQCDGGICFKSTVGQTFPGFDKPLAGGEIICSCPATVPDPTTAKTGFQIAGPYPCERSFFRNCKKVSANTRTGSTIYVGAPTGVAELLTLRLTGKPARVNRCTM
jgi:hypothetical protein